MLKCKEREVNIHCSVRFVRYKTLMAWEKEFWTITGNFRNSKQQEPYRLLQTVNLHWDYHKRLEPFRTFRKSLVSIKRRLSLIIAANWFLFFQGFVSREQSQIFTRISLTTRTNYEYHALTASCSLYPKASSLFSSKRNERVLEAIPVCWCRIFFRSSNFFIR